MAALTESTTDTLFHEVTVDNTATASTFEGPTGAQTFWVRVVTAAAAVRLQVGDQAGVDITTGAKKGILLTTEIWSGLPASKDDAPVQASNRPKVSLQSDTATTVVEYRWTHAEAT